MSDIKTVRSRDTKAIRVTVDNLDQAAEWANGSVRGVRLPKEEQVVRVYSHYYELDANVGDWIVQVSIRTFAVMTSEDFDALFSINE